MTAVILAGCDTGEYFPGDESAGNDSGWQDSVSLPDVATQSDLGNTTNELRLYKSGSRIKAKVLKTADGSQAFMGWYDTQLETDCVASPYYQTEDGKIRYIPSHNVSVSFNQQLFADSTCSKEIYWTGAAKSCKVKTNWIWQMTSVSSMCQAYTITIYRDAVPYNGTEIFHLNSDDSCDDVTESYKTFLFLSDLGEKVDPSIFVEASPELVD